MNKQYLIEWYIDVEAETPQEAAREALSIQRDPDSLATIFTVRGPEGSVCIDADTGAELPSDRPPATPGLLDALLLAEATLERLAPGGSRATQDTRDVIRAAITAEAHTLIGQFTKEA